MPRIVFMLPVFICLILHLPALAEEDCKKAREIYSETGRLLKFEERKAGFKRAVELCPGYAEAYVNLADAYDNLNEFDDAEKYYNEAVKLGLVSTIPFIGLGEVYLKTGRYAAAEAAFTKGFAIDPESDRIRSGLRVARERIKSPHTYLAADRIKDCLLRDSEFQLMCMCPEDHYSFMKKWICIPTIRFASGSWALSADARRQLNEIGKVLNSPEAADRRALIIGHSDSLGSAEANGELSKQRAAEVLNYLSDNLNVAGGRLKQLFFGPDHPRADNSTPKGRAANRRVEIVIQD